VIVSRIAHTAGYPALKEAMSAILLQADEVLVKPMMIRDLVGLIRERAQHREARKLTSTERVASILERDGSATISDWLDRVSRESELTHITMTAEERTGHLPALFRELVERTMAQPDVELFSSRADASRRHVQRIIRDGFSRHMPTGTIRTLIRTSHSRIPGPPGVGVDKRSCCCCGSGRQDFSK
jgi:hypothetical protein